MNTITTVGELIDELAKYPRDKKVGVPADSENGPILIEPVVMVALDDFYGPIDIVVGNEMAMYELGLL